MGTQKNCLNEMVSLEHPKCMLKLMDKKILTFLPSKFFLSRPIALYPLLKNVYPDHKVGRSKPPQVLTGPFNRLKPPGQYAKSGQRWSINLSGRLKFLNDRFGGRLGY